jgi:DNA-binding response OmpR family regulator
MPRVLVVDDNPMIYLERHSFQVTIADGGEAGLRALEGSPFDLMIVDIFMPHMRGFESIRIFHERAPMLPLIARFRFCEPRLAGSRFPEDGT